MILKATAILVPQVAEFREEKFLVELVVIVVVVIVVVVVVVVVLVVKGLGSVLVCPVVMVGTVLEFWNILGLSVVLPPPSPQQTFGRVFSNPHLEFSSSFLAARSPAFTCNRAI